MSIFDFLKPADINAGILECRAAEGAVLLDVRTREEYQQGHIEESSNLPLQEIQKAAERFPDRNTVIYTYCLSGMRSRQAVSALKSMGYQNVKSIGGINRYKGPLVS